MSGGRGTSRRDSKEHQARAAAREPGSLAGSHRGGAARSDAERTVVRGIVVSAVIVLVVLLLTVVWPRVSFLLSGVRPVVDTLGSSAIYVGPGAGRVDTDEIAGIVGTRPVATVVLDGDDELADDALATCEAVVDHLPGLIVQVVVDGKFANGCEGDGLRYGPDVTWTSWDVRFWLEHSYGTSLARGDVPEMVRQLALAYDAEVRGGRLDLVEREFHAPPRRTAIAAGITAGVVGGTVALFVLLRLATRWGFAAADRRRGWERERDEIDGELGEIALVMVGVDPSSADQHDLATAIGRVAQDYRGALEGLDRARPGDDLAPVRDRVRAIRARLDAARTVA